MAVFITGGGVTFNALLPSGYTQLEYIEGTGTQYIDTGIIPSYQTKVTADIEITEVVTNGTPFACRGSNATATDPNGYGFITPTETTLRSTFFGTYLDATCDSVLQRFVVVKDKNVLTALGKTIQNTASTGVGVSNLVVFGMNTNGTVSQIQKMKLYSMSIAESSVNIRNFVPCKDSSGTVGLYDTISKSFFGNAGTGTFVAGPEL